MILYLMLGVYVLVGFGISFGLRAKGYDGTGFEEAPPLVFSLFWPVLLVVALAIGPYYLFERLGKKVYENSKRKS